MGQSVKEELQKQLFDKYPKIFGDHTGSPQETCMCWGLEVGDGWYDIIDVLCQAITNTYSTSLKIDEVDAKHLGVKPYKFKDEVSYIYSVNCPQVVAQQVKEKFGELRFYWQFEFNNDFKYLLETKKYPKLDIILDNFRNFIDGIVHFAEVLAESTCEETGQRGETTENTLRG